MRGVIIPVDWLNNEEEEECAFTLWARSYTLKSDSVIQTNLLYVAVMLSLALSLGLGARDFKGQKGQKKLRRIPDKGGEEREW